MTDDRALRIGEPSKRTGVRLMQPARVTALARDEAVARGVAA